MEIWTDHVLISREAPSDRNVQRGWQSGSTRLGSLTIWPISAIRKLAEGVSMWSMPLHKFLAR
jgi:hypothetical protein